MKKRIISIMLACLSVVYFTSCSSEPKRPENISESMYDIGVKVVNIADKYLNADLTLDEAYEEISSLDDQAKNVKDESYDYDLIVSIDIGSITSDMLTMKDPYGDNATESDIKDARDELADTLGLN